MTHNHLFRKSSCFLNTVTRLHNPSRRAYHLFLTVVPSVRVANVLAPTCVLHLPYPRHLQWCHDERCWLACTIRLMAKRSHPERGRSLTSTRHPFERYSKPGRQFSKGEFVYPPQTTRPIRHLNGDSGLQAEAWNTSASTRSKLSRKGSDSRTCWTRAIPNRVLSYSSMFTLTNILGSSEFGVWLEETRNILQQLE